ncbi:hypothetical protein D3C72_1338560 [compost metagenome]
MAVVYCTPASTDLARSGCRLGWPKLGKYSSLKVGARKALLTLAISLNASVRL